MSGPWRSWAPKVAIALIAFVLLGYLSNSLTESACEQSTRNWMEELLARHPNNWPGRRARAEPAANWLPWFATVDYDWAVSNTGGELGTKRFLTFFGIPIPLGRKIRVIS